jgi:hypothetical protein
MYTMQGKTRPIRHVRFPRQSMYARCTLPVGNPHTWQPFVKSSTTMDRGTAPEKKGSRHNPQRAGWPIRRSIPSLSPEPAGWPIRGSIPNFSPEPAIEGVGVKPSSVSNQLLVLLDPYHRHAIGMFNTCSRGPTHRSLTDTSGGYNLRDSGFPHTTPRHSQPVVSTFS